MYLHCSTKQIFHFSCQTQSLQTVVATVHVLNVCNIVFLYMYSDKFCYLTLFIDIHVTCNVQCRSFLKTENLTHTCMYMSQGPQSHILMTGGGGGGGIFWVWNFGLDFFGSMKDASWVFFGVTKKNRGMFLGCEKRPRDLFGYAKKSSEFWSCDFFGYKIWTTVGPPPPPHPLPPSLKFVSGAPGVHVVLTFEPDLLVITNPWHTKLFCLTATWFQAFKALHVCSVLYIYLVSGLPIKSGEMTGVWFLPGELLVD